MKRISLKPAYITRLLLTIGLILAVISSAAINVEARTAPVYHSIPAYQEKNVFESNTMTVEGLTLEGSFNSEMTLYIFNTTTQELEDTVTAVDGKVPALTLKKEHNYMILGQDEQYKTKSYCWAHDGVLYDIKSWDGKGTEQWYSPLETLKMEAFEAGKDEEHNRYYANIPVMIGDSDGLAYNRKFKLISIYETLEVNTGSKGYLRASLLEDIAYTVVLEDEDYFIQSFPLVVKDKREYDSAVRFTYDHSTCHAVGNMPGDDSKRTPLRIYKKSEVEEVNQTITSLSENTKISGFKFNDIIALERYRDDYNIAGLNGEDYDVLDIVAVNPHRWEISKICIGNFDITEILDTTKKVEALYELKSDGLSELEFTQSGKTLSFQTDSLSVNPIVIKYQKGSEGASDGGEVVSPSDNEKVTTNPDGSTTITIIDSQSGKVTEKTEYPDGTSTVKTEETKTNSSGNTVKIISTILKDMDGNVISESTTIEINEINAVITKTRNAEGKTASSGKLFVTGAPSGKSTSVDISLSSIKQIVELSTTNRVDVISTASNSGQVSITVNAADIKPGSTIYLVRKAASGEYMLVSGDKYKIDSKGNFRTTVAERGSYELVNGGKYKTIVEKIRKTVKLTRSSKTIKKGKTYRLTFSKSLNMKNVKSVKFNTSRKSVARVSSKGTVKARKAGRAVISAKVYLKNGSTKTVKLKVKIRR